MRFLAVKASEVGLVRPNNEDAAAASATLLAVADGVGGAPAGEVASAVAVAALEAAVDRGIDVAEAVQLANEVVAAGAASNSLLTRMCCTLTAVAVQDGRAVLAHVGDSRAWLVRDGEAEQLTADQTIAARLLAAGEITAEEAAVHPKRATLWQVIGRSQRLEVAPVALDLVAGDRLVLATDGLLYAGDEQLPMLLAAEGAPEDHVQQLVAAALAGGGHDNVTVVVADVLT